VPALTEVARHSVGAADGQGAYTILGQTGGAGDAVAAIAGDGVVENVIVEGDRCGRDAATGDVHRRRRDDAAAVDIGRVIKLHIVASPENRLVVWADFNTQLGVALVEEPVLAVVQLPVPVPVHTRVSPAPTVSVNKPAADRDRGAGVLPGREARCRS